MSGKEVYLMFSNEFDKGMENYPVLYAQVIIVNL